MPNRQQHNLKVITIGDSGVGKKAIVESFTGCHLNILKIGLVMTSKYLKIEGKHVVFQLVGTSGDEIFRIVTTDSFRGSHGIVVVYDVTNERSFENIQYWLQQADEHTLRPFQKMLIGNKCDREEERRVSRERGENFARELGIPFMETSAKHNTNIEEAFISLAKEVLPLNSYGWYAFNTRSST